MVGELCTVMRTFPQLELLTKNICSKCQEIGKVLSNITTTTYILLQPLMMDTLNKGHLTISLDPINVH